MAEYDIFTFTPQLARIKNPEIRKLVVTVLQAVPSRFYREGASSTGKYHNPLSQGEGGLVRHTKLLVKFAVVMLELEMYEELVPLEDEILAAVILHDSIKFGWKNDNPWTVAEHPNLAADFVMKKALEQGTVQKDTINRICSAIRSHTGQWNYDKNGNEILPKPTTNMQRFVHLCDYLASRRWMSVSNIDDLN